MPVKQATAVANHVFGGGMLVGFEQAGFDVKADLETFDIGVKTLQKNRPKLDVRQDPEAKSWNVKDYDGVDVLFGNPRCTSFSTLTVGLKHRHGSTGASTLDIRQSFALAKMLRPKLFCLESVQGAATTGWPLLEKLASEMPADYRFAIVFINNIMFVPQQRKRLFIISYRDCEYGPNPPTAIERCTLVGDVIKNLEPAPWLYVRGKKGAELPHDVVFDGKTIYNHVVYNAFDQDKMQDDYKKIPAGVTLEDVNPRDLGEVLKRKREAGTGLSFHCARRLAYDLYSPLIYAASGNYLHPVHDRSITVREAARLMGIPDDYRYIGDRQYAQVGNGVAPPTSKWIAGTLLDAMNGNHEDVVWTYLPKEKRFEQGISGGAKWKFFQFTKVVPNDYETVKARLRAKTKAVAGWKETDYGKNIQNLLVQNAKERQASGKGGLLKGEEKPLEFNNNDGVVDVS